MIIFHFMWVTHLLSLWILASYSSAETLQTIHGVLNGTIILPSGIQKNTFTQIQWSTGGKLIALGIGEEVNVNRLPRFRGRLSLFQENGSLQINRTEMGDQSVYRVKAIYEDGNEYNKELQLLVYEKINKPKLELKKNVSTLGICNISVTCSMGIDVFCAADCDNTQGAFLCSKCDYTDSSFSTSLTVTSNGSSIVCTSSNPVSKDSDVLVNVCPHQDKDSGKIKICKNPCRKQLYWPCILFIVTVIYLCYSLAKEQINKVKTRKVGSHQKDSPEDSHQKDSPEDSHQKDSPLDSPRKDSLEDSLQKDSPEDSHQKHSPEDSHRKDSLEDSLQKDSPEDSHQKHSPEDSHRKDSLEDSLQKDSPEDSHQKDSPVDSHQKDSPLDSPQKDSLEDSLQKDSPED
ncbi:SLAM family member 9 [Amia ocellicauda]|uniref:SLAM family member 9 n=1 Tax=Amia ocellicauda TaxID=2972642 RepID=UPI0034646179